MASRANENRKLDHYSPVPGTAAMPKQTLPSLAISLAVPFCLNAATIFLFGSGKKFDTIPDKPFWIPPLWLVHSASLGSSILMGLAGWIVRARGGLGADSDALPLYVAQVSLGIMWHPLVLVIGSCRLGFVFCVANFGTVVACKYSFQKVTRLAGDVVRICAVWVGFLTYFTLQLSFLQ